MAHTQNCTATATLFRLSYSAVISTPTGHKQTMMLRPHVPSHRHRSPALLLQATNQFDPEEILSPPAGLGLISPAEKEEGSPGTTPPPRPYCAIYPHLAAFGKCPAPPHRRHLGFPLRKNLGFACFAFPGASELGCIEETTRLNVHYRHM